MTEVADIRGRGAWTTLGKDNGSRYYCFLPGKPLDGNDSWVATRWAWDLHHIAVNYGVKAIQARLDALGYLGRGGRRLPVDGVFGQKTKRAVRWFQRGEHLPDDGAVGPVTSGELWKPLVWGYGIEHGGRPDLLWGMTSLESAFDPGAVSSIYKETNGPDLGLCQINQHYNPTVSIDNAFDPNYALLWSAQRLERVLRQYSGKGDRLQEQCAVAYHNSPVRADEWYRTGTPPNEQIETYAQLVLDRAATFVGPDE